MKLHTTYYPTWVENPEEDDVVMGLITESHFEDFLHPLGYDCKKSISKMYNDDNVIDGLVDEGLITRSHTLCTSPYKYRFEIVSEKEFPHLKDRGSGIKGISTIECVKETGEIRVTTYAFDNHGIIPYITNTQCTDSRFYYTGDIGCVDEVYLHLQEVKCDLDRDDFYWMLENKRLPMGVGTTHTINEQGFITNPKNPFETGSIVCMVWRRSVVFKIPFHWYLKET